MMTDMSAMFAVEERSILAAPGEPSGLISDAELYVAEAVEDFETRRRQRLERLMAEQAIMDEIIAGTYNDRFKEEEAKPREVNVLKVFTETSRVAQLEPEGKEGMPSWLLSTGNLWDPNITGFA